MLLTIAYHKGNKDFAQAQCDHIRKLCGKLPYPVLYVLDRTDSIDYAGISDNVSELAVDLASFEYPFVTTQAFKACAQEAHRRNLNFVFIEPDVLVLQPNFMVLLETALLMSGKRAVFTENRWEPHDLVTGNGAYRTDVVVAWKDALETPVGAWDGYAERHYAHDIYRSPLIYHKYGEYDAEGFAHPYEFHLDEMRDAAIAHKLWDLKIYEGRHD